MLISYSLASVTLTNCFFSSISLMTEITCLFSTSSSKDYYDKNDLGKNAFVFFKPLIFKWQPISSLDLTYPISICPTFKVFSSTYSISANESCTLPAFLGFTSVPTIKSPG
jgi:hypothetical protein